MKSRQLFVTAVVVFVMVVAFANMLTVSRTPEVGAPGVGTGTGGGARSGTGACASGSVSVSAPGIGSVVTTASTCFP